MIEYEYSFKVKDIIPYINYCIDNNFEKVRETFQTRVLYKNLNNILARITTQKNENNIVTYINLKDENESAEVLKVSRETRDLIVTDENKEFFIEMLEILKFNKFKILERKRYVYVKSNIVFEIDEYTSPERMYVVAIEGEKQEVDCIYNEIIQKFDSYMIK